MVGIGLRLRDLGDYEAALLMKAKIEACLAAVVTDESEETLTTPSSSLLRDSQGRAVESFEPGMILYRRGHGDVSVVNPSGGGSPRLTPAAIAAAASPVAAPVVLVELDFASGFFRAWTGIGPLHWAGKVFEGLGAIGAVSEIEETVELRAVRLTLSLSPVPQEVVDIALAERSFRLRPARLWGVLLDAEGAFVADPFPLWAGLMDVMEVTDGTEARIALTCESRLVDLERAEVRRYTDADQQAEYQGDRFFEYVPALQEAEIRLPAQ